MGPLRVSNVLRPDNQVAGPWVGWAHGGVCSVCGRAQWPWRILRTAGAAGVRVYFWVRVRLGVWEQWRWRVLRAGSVGLLLRRRILVEFRTLLCGAFSAYGRGPSGVACFGYSWGLLRGVFSVLLWPVPFTAGAAGVRGYLWARVRWVFGSSGVGMFRVSALGLSCLF